MKSEIFRIYIHNSKSKDEYYEVCYKSHLSRRYSFLTLPQTARDFITYGNHSVIKDDKGNPVRYENKE